MKGKRVLRRTLSQRWRWCLLMPLCCILVTGLAVAAFARPSLPVPDPAPSRVQGMRIVTAATTRPVVTPPPDPLPTPSPGPTPSPLPTYDFTLVAPERETVEATYFDDAVFLGDSRTDGLRLYSGLRGPDFLYRNGVTIYDVEKKQLIKGEDGKKHTMMAALAWKQYSKVYLMFGINELGYGDNAQFRDAFAKVIDDIRAAQPNAVIYIESIIPINPAKAKANTQPTYITNEKIVAYNALLQALATEKQVVYLDLATALSDENGVLPAENSTDGIHFKRAWYVKWYEYLQNHTVDAATYFASQTPVVPQ